MVDNAIKPAIRTALRFHEIGNDTPYRISFAGKGKSGGSFGFMQGDLAAGQPDVTSTFRDAMTRAGMSAQKINELLALLSKHQIKNPLSAADTAAVNQALQAAHDLVDAMDDQILEGVNRYVDICLAHASRQNRSVETKAVVYMAMWINMSGPPTKLLTWLDGGDPSLARDIPAAGRTVTGAALEDYLAATNYYVENPQNLQHLRECAVAGMKELGDTPTIFALQLGASIDGAQLLAAAAPPPSSVTISAQSSDGSAYQVSIRKNGRDTGTIGLHNSGGSPTNYDVTAVQARADGSKLVCHGPWTSIITCTLSAGRNFVSDAIEIAVTNAWPRNGVTIYTTAHADFERLKDFIGQAGFPVLDTAPPASPAATGVSAYTAGDAGGALALASPGSGNVYDSAIQAIELWRLQKSSPDYDHDVDPLVRLAASKVKRSPNIDEIVQWLNVQSSARGIADPEITGTTLALRETASQEFASALRQLPVATRLRVDLELGAATTGPIKVDANETLLQSSFSAAAAAGTQPLGVFVGQSQFTSVRKYPVMHGALKLQSRKGDTLGTYTVNSGGGAPNFHTTNGPIPPGIYRLSNYRARSIEGMVLHDVGYSFDLDPVFDTPVFGRSLFRLHPDGGSPQTNGCLGIRENSADRLRDFRDQLRSLLEGGDVYISVAYGNLMS